MSNPIRDSIRDSILHECKVIQHLYAKVPSGGMDFRFSPEQRSTLELLRYIATVGLASARVSVASDWDVYKETAQKSNEMTADEFPALMDEQIQGLEEIFAGLTDKDLVERTSLLVTRREVPLLRGLMDTTLKWLATYRMQLFLHAKGAGATEIGTVNNWLGVDPEKKD